MNTIESRHLFDRLVTVHRPDCDMLADVMPGSSIACSESQMASSFSDDASLKYALDTKPIYEDLRRVIGQLAGLLILAQLTNRVEMVEFPERNNCEQRWKSAGTRIASLTAPGPLAPHKEQLSAAHSLSGMVLRSLAQLRPGAENNQQFDQMSDQIKRAYRHLASASSEKAGLQMVDFTHACCSCVR